MDETKKPQSIAEEAGLPDNWVPLDVPPIIPGRTEVGQVDGSQRFLQGSLPPGYQHDSSFVNTEYKAASTPNLALMPLGLTGNPTTNAAIQSTATKAAAAGSSSQLISLSIPNIFTPTLQTESNGLLQFSLASQPGNYVFAGPSGTILDDLDTIRTAALNTTAISISASPSQSGDFAIVFTAQDNGGSVTFAPDVSWTSVIASGTHQSTYSKTDSTGNPVTASGMGDPSFPVWCSLLAMFATDGSTPAVVNSHVVQSGAFGSVSSAIGFTPTAGHSLLAILMSSSTNTISGPATITSFQDNHGDTWQFLGSVSNGSGNGVQAVLYGVSNITGGATTVNVSFDRTIAASNFIVIEVTHLAPLLNIPPRFRPLVGGDIPPIHLDKVNVNGGVTGIIGTASLPSDIAYVDVTNIFTKTQTFQPTGGSTTEAIFAGGFSSFSQFSQFSNLYVRYDQFFGGLTTPWTNYSFVVGGGSTFPILGIAPASGATGNLIDGYAPGSGTIKNFSVSSGGKIPNYGGIATVSGGVPAEYATVDLTAQAADIAATTLYAVPAAGQGMYRISAYVVETTAGSVSSTLPNVQIVYTDPDTNTSITIDATPILGVAGIGQTGPLTNNTVGTATSGVIVISAKASTNIQYQTVNYASTAAGMQYAIHLKLEAM